MPVRLNYSKIKKKYISYFNKSQTSCPLILNNKMLYGQILNFNNLHAQYITCDEAILSNETLT